MAFAQNVSNIVTFQCVNAWRGMYQNVDVTEEAFSHVEAICAICLEMFQGRDYLIVFSCSHGFHNRCFANWTRKKCPTCMSAVEKVIQARLLGCSIQFSDKNQAIARFLYGQRHWINCCLQRLIWRCIKNPYRHCNSVKKFQSW